MIGSKMGGETVGSKLLLVAAKIKVKQSHYTTWKHLGGEEV
jgi:hypothetical protein